VTVGTETVTAAPASADTGPRPKLYTVERPKFPLAFKLFGLTALLIAGVVAVAVAITIERANTIANVSVKTSISGAAKLFRELERQRLDRLDLGTRLLGSDISFYAYIQTSLHPASTPAPAAAPGQPVAEPAPSPGPDLVSILDQLGDRRRLLRSDLLMLLDDEGRVVARTDQPDVTEGARLDLYDSSPLVKRVVDDATAESASGVLDLKGRLYHAAVAPIAAGANKVRIGYLVNALDIDEAFASSIGGSTSAGVIFKSGQLVRSQNAPAFTMEQMTSVDQIFKTNKAMPPSNVQIDNSRYVMTGEPLMAGTKTLGAAVFVRSLDKELAPFKEIEKALLLGGGLALLLALLFSWLIAKRVTHPIEELAGLAQAVTAGDYTVHPNIDRSDEVGILGRSFAQMITTLRDKSELEELYEQMSAISAERDAAGPRAAVEAPKMEEGTILVTDLRGLAPAEDGNADKVIATVSRVMNIQESEVNRQEGQVREIVGNRLVSIFRGDRGIIHAIRAARAINEELASQADMGKMSVAVGVATGEFVTGSISLANDNGLAIVGDAPLLASLFAWHAPAGYAYISYETAQTAGGDIQQQATREEVKLKWLAQPLAVASMPLASLTTSVMRSIGDATTSSSMATMKIDGTGTQPGTTAPQMPQQDLPSGTVFANRYRIEQVLGRGGMGIVYKAVDTQLDETVAIKTLSGDVMMRSPEELERFKREIRLARKITHRNILRTYDYGEADGVYFISMEFVRGYTLAELLEESPNHQMVSRLAVGIGRQICRGLQAAHEQGIIHRDIKPQNVLIDHKGEVKLMDFGIARMAEAHEGMTQAGLIVGTPHYMSPEQVQGKLLDPRSDVYSMGVMLYEMLVGEKPFVSEALTGVLMAHITEQPRPPIDRKPEIGREINGIVLRSLAKDPANRYSDAGALLAALDRVQMATAAAA
jgi:eukaryotic-like serine/threonine-protein kinase